MIKLQLKKKIEKRYRSSSTQLENIYIGKPTQRTVNVSAYYFLPAGNFLLSSEK